MIERWAVEVETHKADYLTGTRALSEGRLAEAIAAFGRVPQESPCWVMAQGNVGLALLTMTRYQEAEVHLHRVLEEIERRGCPDPPAHVQFQRNYAEALIQQHRWAEAIQEIARACEAADRLAQEHPSLMAQIECEKAHALNSSGAALLQQGLPAQAVEVLNRAREILRRHSGDDRTGHAEVLTHLALALDATGRGTSAGFALGEAVDIATATGNSDQLFRILVVADRIGADLTPSDRVLDLIEAGAAQALETERPGIAYLRYCTGASLASRGGGNVEAGRRIVGIARELEGRIDPHDPNVPKMRYFEAMLLREAGEPPARFTNALVEGAHHWYRRIAVPLVPADFRSRTSDLHFHVRLLAGCLLEAGRLEEGLVAFEAGRALGYAVDIDPAFFSRVVLRNPFPEDGGGVDLTLLRQAQVGLGPDDVAVVLGVIPPRIVAFLVGRNSVECVAVDAAVRQADLDLLDAQLKVLPRRLAEGVGLRAVPGAVLSLTREIARRIGPRAVASVIPYNSLHMVPWRAILRECGLPWGRLAFPVGFSSLLRRGGKPPEAYEGTVLTLGYGTAGGVDLREEAEQFARAFAGRNTALPRCRAADVRRALQSDAVVLLSCHGQAVNEAEGSGLILHLEDGAARAGDVFPPRVSAPLVILSACDSGVYFMAWGDYPLGAAPALLQRGARAVIGARFPIDARYAADFFTSAAQRLAAGASVELAFSATLEEMEGGGSDRWRDLACLELLSAL